MNNALSTSASLSTRLLQSHWLFVIIWLTSLQMQYALSQGSVTYWPMGQIWLAEPLDPAQRCVALWEWILPASTLFVPWGDTSSSSRRVLVPIFLPLTQGGAFWPAARCGQMCQIILFLFPGWVDGTGTSKLTLWRWEFKYWFPEILLHAALKYAFCTYFMPAQCNCLTDSFNIWIVLQSTYFWHF